MALALVGCDNGSSGSPISGTWIQDDNPTWQTTYRNGRYEASFNGVPVTRGTYRTSGNELRSTWTHVSGYFMPQLNLGPGWHTTAQYFSAVETWYREMGWSEELIATAMEGMRNPPPSRTTFSISGSTLTLTTVNLQSGQVTITQTFTRR